jgi:outer membrane protein
MKRVIASICAGLLCTAGFAQLAPKDTATLLYNEAIKIGLDKNVLLNQQKNTLFTRQVQRNASILAFAPNLYAQGQANRNTGQQTNPDNGNFEDLTVENVYGNVTSELNLFNGLSRINSLGQYKHLFNSQLSAVQRAEQDAIFNITNQYLQVLLDQELLRIATENYNTQNVVLAQLREQVNVGSRAESEMYTQDAQVRNMELLALRARVTLYNDKAILAQTLQLDPVIPFKVTFPEFSENVLGASDDQLDSLYAVATNNRPDLKQQESLMLSNKYAFKASSNSYFPRLTAFASYGTQYYSVLPFTFREQMWDRNLNLTYGLNFYIPIYDRSVTRSTRVTNKMLYENSKLQYENLEKTVKIDVQRAFNNYKAAIQAYKSSQVQFQAGELALKTQQESFILGASNQVTLAQANQTFVQAAASRAQAEVTLVFQKVLIEYALGTLRPE